MENSGVVHMLKNKKTEGNLLNLHNLNDQLAQLVFCSFIVLLCMSLISFTEAYYINRQLVLCAHMFNLA